MRLIVRNIHNNTLQVINQYEAEGERNCRYDVTILVNGLPLVHIELKRRGVAIREAFNQIRRYGRDSFWGGLGLFGYVQLFVISNGTHTKYYSNTTRLRHLNEFHKAVMRRGGLMGRKFTSNSFEFTSWWTDAENRTIGDLVDFAKTFFSKHVLLNILTRYCVFDTTETLLVMRPYQIAATERILSRVLVAKNHGWEGSVRGGGYVWHTTGSGKTLTSFKTAILASKMEGIDKVLFVVDRSDLDYQTIKEYDRFQKGAAIDTEEAMMDPRRISAVVKYIIDNFDQKTYRRFNSILAVSSIPAAMRYYDEFKRQGLRPPNGTECGDESCCGGVSRRLKVATIFTYCANEDDVEDGYLDAGGDPSKLPKQSRDFLDGAIADYNEMFGTNFDTSGDRFQNYYRDLSLKMKTRQIDVLIVVNMFLTGFDATTLNTLWGSMLKMRNILAAFDEFEGKDVLPDRERQDYQSVYLDMYGKYRELKKVEKESITDDIVFEMELVRQVDVNIDYILMLVEKYRGEQGKDKEIKAASWTSFKPCSTGIRESPTQEDRRVY